jgi:hypothetical protein
MRVAEVDDWRCTVVSIRGLRRKRVRTQAYKTEGEIRAAQAVPNSICPNEGINIFIHRLV